MKEIYYTYNNEAIACCIFLNILQEIEPIDIARSCLILPFLLDDKTVAYLQKNISADLDLGDFIKSQPRLFISFNKRYQALLPISINALIILNKSNQISIDSNISMKNDILQSIISLGNRLEQINEVIPSFITLIEKYTTTQLYQLLKIQL